MIDASSVKGVIFDLDGTLVDSCLDFDQMRRDLGFPAGQPILEHMATMKDAAAIAKAEAIILRHELEGARVATLMPGVERLLMILCERQLPMAIITRNIRAAAQQTIEKLQIPIELLLTREDCKPKPDPEGLLLVAQQWVCEPGDLVYIGDYKFDIEAANNAGMISCLYRHERNAAFAESADWVIDHFDELSVVFKRSF